MCGLFGVFYKKATTKKLSHDAISLGVYLTQLRGVHSLGMIYASNTKEAVRIGSYKESMHDSGNITLTTTYQTPHEKLTRGSNFDRYINDKDICMLAFHTRHATRGQKTRENSHPFRMEHVTLMHNGTLRNDYQINNKYFEVDSMALAHYLDQEGSTVQGLVDKVNGAYALVWTDLRDPGGSVNFVRNTERPLVILENDDLIMWASTRSVLGAIAAEYGIKAKQFEELAPFTHVKVTLATGEVVRTTLKEPPKATSSFYYGGGDVYDMYDTAATSTTKEAAQKHGNFPIANQAGGSAGNSGANIDRKGGSTSVDATSLSSLVPNTYEWFTKLVTIGERGCMASSIHNIGRSPFLPSVHQRIEYGLVSCRTRKVTNPVFGKGTYVTLSVFNEEILDYDPIDNKVVVTAHLPVASNNSGTKYDITVELKADVYRRAVYNSMLIGAVISQSVYQLSDNTWEINAASGHLIFAFDPSVQGIRDLATGALILDKTLDEELVSGGFGMGNC